MAQKLQRAWANYIECRPKAAEYEQAWLRNVSGAEVVNHGTQTLDEETGFVDWPKMAGVDKIGVIKVAWMSEEEYAVDSSMYVVTLPWSLLRMVNRPGSNILFFRNEDIGLMKAWWKYENSVIIANPGFSKSWHLWKYLVVVLKPEVWRLLGEDLAVLPQPQIIMFWRNGAAVSVDAFFLLLEQDKFVELRETSQLVYLRSGLFCSTAKYKSCMSQREASTQEAPGVRGIPCVAACSPDTQLNKEFANSMMQRYLIYHTRHGMNYSRWGRV